MLQVMHQVINQYVARVESPTNFLRVSQNESDTISLLPDNMDTLMSANSIDTNSRIIATGNVTSITVQGIPANLDASTLAGTSTLTLLTSTVPGKSFLNMWGWMYICVCYLYVLLYLNV